MKPAWSRLTYWSCQAVGWGLWCVLGLAMVRVQRGSIDTGSAVGYVLFFFYSIGLTHLLGRVIERRGWLALEPLALLARLAGAVLTTSAIQTTLVMLVSVALTGTASELPNPKSIVFFWMNLTFGTGVWTTLYITITSSVRARRAREQSAALEGSLNRARLKSLEAQVSPHFLFNCLNSLRGMIGENPPLAQDMVTRLANILRHNLVRDAESTEMLGEQVGVMSDYLALESVRFDERLRTRLEITPATENCAVPAMLLQTLVENAIKHGIAHLPAGGDIIIRSRLDDDMLVITVENSGRIAATKSPGSTGVGLANLRERLQLLFGPAATLDLAAPEADRVRATVRLPARRTTPAPLRS